MNPDTKRRTLLVQASIMATVTVIALVGSALLAKWHWRSQDPESAGRTAFANGDSGRVVELLGSRVGDDSAGSGAAATLTGHGLILLADCAVLEGRLELAETAAELAVFRPEPDTTALHRDVILARSDLSRFGRARAQAELGASDPTILRSATTSIRSAIEHLRDAVRQPGATDSVRRDLERVLRLAAEFDRANAEQNPDQPDENRTSIDLGPEGGEADPQGQRTTEETEIGGSDAVAGDGLQTLSEKLEREIGERQSLRREAFERRTRGRRDW